MDKRAAGDVPLVSNRVNEKADLQNLNHRFAAYIQTVRSAHERQNQQLTQDSNHPEEKFSNSLRLQYEQQIADLQVRLQEVAKEKLELEMNRTYYDTAVNDYESRIVSLNGSVYEKQNELQRLHSALASKNVELQQAMADATHPRMAFEGARLEVEDLRKKLEEAERRLQLEVNEKMKIHQELSSIQGKMQQESMLHQQQLTDLKKQLENSRSLIVQLKENARNAGQVEYGLAEMMKNVRAASEAELRRFIEDRDAKYDLNIKEIKMRMDADAQSLVALAEENAKLQAEIDSHAADVRTLETKLSIAEDQRNSAISALENERSSFQSNSRSLERKLQETQDLLLVKIQELGVAQEANIPLRAEINALKLLVEEEEKRLQLDTASPGRLFVSSPIGRHNLTSSPSFIEMLGSETHMGMSGAPLITQPADSRSLYQSHNVVSTTPSNVGKVSIRPASVPAATSAFQYSSASKRSLSNIPLASPTFLPTNRDEAVGRSFPETKVSSSSTESLNSQLFGLKEDRNITQVIGLDDLPPRPENPTPDHLPHRSLSAINSRFIPASEGQGKDYFDAMFNDLRRDTMYSKVTEDGASTSRYSTSGRGFMHSTPRLEEKSGKSTRAWFSGSSASATGDLKVLQVSDDGAYVSVSNTSASHAENIGGFMLQQNVGGHPVAVFRFPPRAELKPSASATVWSCKARDGVHNPPFDYIWTQLDKWGTGPECTTILCKPNGQAVAWTAPALRTAKDSKSSADGKKRMEEAEKLREDLRLKMANVDSDAIEEAEDGSGMDLLSSASKPERPKSTPVISRTAQSSGLLTARTGSAPLRLHKPKPPMRGVSEMYEGQAPYHAPWSEDGQDDDEEKYPLVKSAPPNRPHPNDTFDSQRHTLQSAPAGITGSYENGEVHRKSPGQSARVRLPGTFWPPAEQHKRGMEWIRSQHNTHFLPPMPKAFPCVTPMYRTLNKTC